MHVTPTGPSLFICAVFTMHSRLDRFCQVAASFFEYRQSSESAFAERFKYDVISSSLLSSAIAATPTTRRTFGSDLPGKLDDAGDGSSSDEDQPHTATPLSPLSEFQVPIALVAVAAVALAAEYYFVAMFLMLAATYSWHSVKASAERATTTENVRLVLADIASDVFIVACRLWRLSISSSEQAMFGTLQCTKLSLSLRRRNGGE